MLKTIALILFALMYVMMILLPARRALVAFLTAVIFIVIGIIPLKDAIVNIDANVLMMLAGTMITVDFFIRSKMPNRIADRILQIAPNVMWVTIFMSLFAGIISALIDNVSTVLMVAPVGMAVCRQLKIRPVPMIICIAVSSNLQGAATLVGDATSVMLGAYAKMDFTEFFWMQGRPGIFFAVELGAIATIPIMMFLFRKDREPVKPGNLTVVKNMGPSVILILQIFSLVAASFIPDKPGITNGVICICGAIVSILWDSVRAHREGRKTDIVGTLSNVDVDTLLLLASLFMVIAGIMRVGIIDDLAMLIGKIGGKDLFLLYTIVVWGSVFISAFIDNIPYVATMLPVLKGLTIGLGAEPSLLYFGLLIGATLGGNLTPFGASANIAGVGLLRKEGEQVSNADFFRIGIPFTLTAVVIGYIFLWFARV